MANVIDQAKDLVYSLSEYFLSLSPELQWNQDNPPTLSLANPILDTGVVLAIINEAEQLLNTEPTLLTLSAPVVVVGDIHGQCCDLVRIFYYTLSEDLVTRNTFRHERMTSSDNQTQDMCPPLPQLSDGYYSFDPQKTPGLEKLKLPCKDKQHCYLFLGDYVDRGYYSSECILFLLALKLVYPSQIYLLRGNHESRSMTQREYAEGINFCADCELKYGSDVYEAIMKSFDSLPLAAIVENTMGQWMCCHGGIGSKITSLDVIKSINRFLEPPLSGPMCDLLWADPLLEEVLGKRMSDKDYKEFLELDYIPNPPRGCSCFYGYAAITPLLKECDLLGIIRAHQCKEEGIGFAYTDNREQLFPFPLVTTVFSAANYCGTYTNKGALFVILPSELQIVKYNSDGETWVECAPYCPPEPIQLKIDVIPEESWSPVLDTVPDIKPVQFRRRTGAMAQEDKKHLGIENIPAGPVRSVSFSYPAVPVKVGKRGALRRRSMHMIRNGYTGETGSKEFQLALQQDALHEVHPGWDSIRRLAGVVGRMQVIRKREKSVDEETLLSPTSLTNTDSTSNTSQPSFRRNFSKSILKQAGTNDEQQIKLIFNSIDTNGDGQLSMQELEDFALQLGMVHAATDEMKREMKDMLNEMDEDKNGHVSLEEFTRYLAALSLLEEQRILTESTVT